MLDVLPDATPGGYTVDDTQLIAANYLSQCAAAGLNAAFLWAQMCHETDYLRSFWAQRPQRNPAGVGVNGQYRLTPPSVRPDIPGPWSYNTQRHRWERGISFATWVNASIPAHLGRLLAYMFSDAQLADDPGLPTKLRDVQTRRRALVAASMGNPLPAIGRGSVGTLKQLGSRHNPVNAAAIAAGLLSNKWPFQGWAHTGDRYGAMLAAIANTIVREA